MAHSTENETVNEPGQSGGQALSGSVAAPTGRRRRKAVPLVVAAVVLVVVSVVIGALVSHRKAPAGPPGWVAGPVPAPAAVAPIEANVGRLLARESSVLAAAAERAGRVAELATLLASSLDGPAFQDALSTEPWWKEFRAYGCAVLIGGEVKAVFQLPGSGLPPGELARAVGAPAVAGSPAARVVVGPSAPVLGAMAPLAGVKDGRVLLAEALDRRRIALLAARANVVLMLSDGTKDLGASLPDDSVPLLDGLVGHESSHVMIERHLSQLAVAVPWTSGLWLWVITPQE